MSEQYVYGLHAVTALLTNRYRSTKVLYVNQERVDKRLQDLLDLAQQSSTPVERLSAHRMDQRFAEFTHQGVVAVASKLPEYTESDLGRLLELSKQPALILILDGVTDPHNLGACLRSADGAGVDFVIIPKDKNASVTPVVSKVPAVLLNRCPLCV